MTLYPSATISPREFEQFVVASFEQTRPQVDDLEIRLHEKIQGTDGAYDFDATVRYSFGGMRYLVVVEAKHHSNPIKLEVVQALHSKLQSVGAHKAVVVASAPFQRGALDFALVHGVALVQVTEGRFTYVARSQTPKPTLTREEAAQLDIPPFVGYCYSAGETECSIACTLVTDLPDYAAELLLGVPRPA